MSRNINIEIGKRIIEVRKNMNMKQSEFASLCGISRQSLCNIERGKNSLTMETLITICNATRISADYIVLNKTANNNLAYHKRIESKFSEYSEEELKSTFKIIHDIINC